MSFASIMKQRWSENSLGRSQGFSLCFAWCNAALVALFDGGGQAVAVIEFLQQISYLLQICTHLDYSGYGNEAIPTNQSYIRGGSLVSLPPGYSAQDPTSSFGALSA